MGYRLNRLDEHVFMAVPRPMHDTRIVDGFWLTLLSCKCGHECHFKLPKEALIQFCGMYFLVVLRLPVIAMQ